MAETPNDTKPMIDSADGGPNPNSKSAGRSLTILPGAQPTVRSAAKKEAKRLEKKAKLAAKAVKAAVTPSSGGGEKKAKGKKEKAEEEDAPFVNSTPKGHKKGACPSSRGDASVCCVLMRLQT